jgi:hypothetical protein
VKKVQQAGDYSIYRKRSGRYAVQSKDKRWVNADEKTKILLDAGLIEASAPKPAPPEDTLAAPTGDSAGDEAGDASES